MNEQIAPMARAQGAVLVDVHAAFLAAGDLTRLFVDHVHPNDAGYQIVAKTFFDAITQPAAAASEELPVPLLFHEAGGATHPTQQPAWQGEIGHDRAGRAGAEPGASRAR
jgi:hypothetical protein